MNNFPDYEKSRYIDTVLFLLDNLCYLCSCLAPPRQAFQLFAGQTISLLYFCSLISCFLLLSMWLGIELDQPVGKNDGSVAGVRYFDCKPSHGVFAPPAKVTK